MTRNRVPVTRTIYNNYDLSDMWDYAKENLEENGIEEPTDNQIWEEIYELDSLNWEDEEERLKECFDNSGKHFILVGSVGRWNGVYTGGFLFRTLQEMLSKATEDCDYIHFYDENGHLFLHCSHHDGSCQYEIKEVTDEGYEYLERWEEDWNDKRTEQYVHTQIMKRYSRLPNFAHRFYGCKLRDYEPISKGKLIDMISREAKSFYC